MAVKKLAPKQSKTAMAKEMGISRASLYYQPKLPDKDLKLKAEIEQTLVIHKAYGHKRIALALNINKKRVLRVMKIFGLKPRRTRKSPFKRADIEQAPMNIPNLILGTIVEAQGVVWVADFTYLPFFGKFVYLATVEDYFTRQVVGWAISFKHNANLVSEALLNALEQFNPPDIAHSDQGSEYRSQDYLALLKSLNTKPSMSQKASPWQNGRQESFYSGFKLELGHPEAYLSIGELAEAIALQIHYYNNLRIHTALKSPPSVFAEKIRFAAEQKEKTLDFNYQNYPLTFPSVEVRQSV